MALSVRSAKASAVSKRAQSSKRDSEPSAVKTLRKAFELLRIVGASQQPLTIAEAASVAGIPRPTAYRLVQTLVSEGFLAQDEIGGRLSVGLGVLPLAAGHLDTNRMRLEALPHLNELAQRGGERVNLGILYRGQVLYLAGVERPSLPTIYSRFGRTVPIHCCSMGKAILAYLPEQEIGATMPATFEHATVHSITNADDFRAELRRTKEQGYAVDREEYMIGTFCVGVPIFDQKRYPVAAVSLSGRNFESLLKELPQIQHTAEVISHISRAF